MNRLMFLIKFILFSLPIVFIDNINLDILNRITAYAANKIINGILFQSFFGPAIYYNNKTIVITNKCTGMVSIWLLFALILSSKGKLKKKVLFLVFGALIIYLVNIARIAIIAKYDLYNRDEIVWYLSNFASLVIFYTYLKI